MWFIFFPFNLLLFCMPMRTSNSRAILPLWSTYIFKFGISKSTTHLHQMFCHQATVAGWQQSCGMQIKNLLGFIWKLDMLGIAHHLYLAFVLYLQHASKTQDLLSCICDCYSILCPPFWAQLSCCKLLPRVWPWQQEPGWEEPECHYIMTWSIHSWNKMLFVSFV